jgi:hypothetical protein
VTVITFPMLVPLEADVSDAHYISRAPVLRARMNANVGFVDHRAGERLTASMCVRSVNPRATLSAFPLEPFEHEGLAWSVEG